MDRALVIAYDCAVPLMLRHTGNHWAPLEL